MIPKNDVVGSFFANRLTRQIRELYSATLILDLATAMISIFEPVFVFVYFNKYYTLATALQYMALFYLAVYVLYFFWMPLGAKFAKRFGYENSIALASIFQIIFYFSLFAVNRSPWAIIVAVIFYGIAKTFYWPAYHVNFAKNCSMEERGREISNLAALQSFVFVVGPLIGGLILEYYGFKVLFIVVSILILASNIPMLVTKEVFEVKGYSYFSAYRRLWQGIKDGRVLAFFGFGEEWIVLNIWPIFIFLTAKDYLGLGVISAVSIFITTLVVLFVGRMADRGNKILILRWGSIFYFFSWLLKVLARTALGVTLLDVYSRVAKNFIAVPLTASLYGDAHHSSAMDKVIFFEMSLVLGKIMAILACIVALYFFDPGWNSMFILAGVFTLFYLLFNKKR